MLTVDFDRLGLRPGERVLDMGAGAGRHSFEMYRRGADVIAFDMDAEELENVRNLFVAMEEAGEVPDGAQADVKQGNALQLPFADGEFDHISEQAFYNIGGLEDLERNWARIQKEYGA